MSVSLDGDGVVTGVSEFILDGDDVIAVDAYTLVNKTYTFNTAITTLNAFKALEAAPVNLYDVEIQSRTFLNADGTPKMSVSLAGDGVVTGVSEFILDGDDEIGRAHV